MKGKPIKGLENYQLDKYLGKGSFGWVFLVIEKSSGKKYAMKIIEKAKIQ